MKSIKYSVSNPFLGTKDTAVNKANFLPTRTLHLMKRNKWKINKCVSDDGKYYGEKILKGMREIECWEELQFTCSDNQCKALRTVYGNIKCSTNVSCNYFNITEGSRANKITSDIHRELKTL